MRLFFVLLSVWMYSAATQNAEPKFTTDWFSPHQELWKSQLQRYKGKPGVTYLEVGVYEGRSLIWVMQNILTSKSARAYAVDVFSEPYQNQFKKNLSVTQLTKKVAILRGHSKTVLPKLSKEKFDIVYIDASHMARDVLRDAILVWDLLKVGGILIFDDYGLRPWLPLDARPHLAIDTFLTAFGAQINLLHKGYQVFVEKKLDPCEEAHCIEFGNMAYFFYEHRLKNMSTQRQHQLGVDEAKFLEEFAFKDSKQLGQVERQITSEAQQNQRLKELFRKYEIRL